MGEKNEEIEWNNMKNRKMGRNEILEREREEKEKRIWVRKKQRRREKS